MHILGIPTRDRRLGLEGFIAIAWHLICHLGNQDSFPRCVLQPTRVWGHIKHPPVDFMETPTKRMVLAGFDRVQLVAFVTSEAKGVLQPPLAVAA